MEKKLKLSATGADGRLDKFIAENCPQLSRSHAHELIAKELVLVNGSPTKPSHKLSSGDEVAITIPPEKPLNIIPQDIPLSIIYEDEDLAVVDKPAGMTAHPAPGHPDNTLINAILAHFPDLPAGSDALRPGIVHRLDKDTSGLMLVAKNRLSLANLSEQFKERSVIKKYFVLVKGRISPENGEINAPISRHPHQRKRMAITENGRDALTKYQLLKYIGQYSLLEVSPITGRTHQIRVHMAAIGFPVAGDATYGVKTPGLERQFVHAYCLGFKLPSDGNYVELTTKLPPDLEKALTAIS